MFLTKRKKKENQVIAFVYFLPHFSRRLINTNILWLPYNVFEKDNYPNIF